MQLSSLKTFIVVAAIGIAAVLAPAQGVDPGVSLDRKTAKPAVKKPAAKPGPSRPAGLATPVKIKRPRTQAAPPPVTAGALNVSVDQSGVRIFLDEDEYDTETGASPFIFDGLAPKQYKVRVQKDGYRTEEKTVDLSPRLTLSLEFRLIPLTGRLDITSNVPGAVIEINNQAFRDRIDGLVLPEGNYSFTASKKGYKQASGSVKIEGGRSSSQVVLFEPLGIGELLAEAQKTAAAGDNTEALGLCRQILRREPENIDALLTAAQIYDRLNYFRDSSAYYSLALSKGARISLPVTFSRKETVQAKGMLALQGPNLSFWDEKDPGSIYQTTAPQMQELKIDSGRISLRANVSTGSKAKKENFFFSPVETGSLQKTFTLMQQLKTGVGYRTTGFGVVYLPSERFAKISKYGVTLEIPDNWQDFSSRTANIGTSVGYGPQGASAEVNKQIQYSHGIWYGVVRPAPGTASSLDVMTENFVRAILRLQPGYQKKTEIRETVIDGRRALTVVISGRTSVDVQEDVATFYFSLTPDGSFFYFDTVSPPMEEGDYQPTFERIVNSIRFN